MSIECPDDPHLFGNSTSYTTARIFENLIAFSTQYKLVHPYLSSFICSLGICLNLVHILVLTRRRMTPYIVNSILALIAVCDVITMCSYLIYTARFELFANDANDIGYSFYWLFFLLVHVVVSIALHTISLYLIVIMACIRLVALERLDSRWTKHQSIRWIFVVVCVVVLVLSMPSLFVHDIVPVNELLNSTKYDGLYSVDINPTVMENSCRIFKWNLWLTGIAFKVIPCLLLVLFTIVLVKKLYDTGQKRRLLYKHTTDINGNIRNKAKTRCDKTTFMLVILLAVFLCTELPQGVVAILNAIYTNDVHILIYTALGELLDLLSLINCNVGFFLYVCMSSHYRKTFVAFFQLDKSRFSSHSNQFTALRLYVTDIVGNGVHRSV